VCAPFLRLSLAAITFRLLQAEGRRADTAAATEAAARLLHERDALRARESRLQRLRGVDVVALAAVPRDACGEATPPQLLLVAPAVAEPQPIGAPSAEPQGGRGAQSTSLAAFAAPATGLHGERGSADAQLGGLAQSTVLASYAGRAPRPLPASSPSPAYALVTVVEPPPHVRRQWRDLRSDALVSCAAAAGSATAAAAAAAAVEHLRYVYVVHRSYAEFVVLFSQVPHAWRSYSSPCFVPVLPDPVSSAGGGICGGGRRGRRLGAEVVPMSSGGVGGGAELPPWARLDVEGDGSPEYLAMLSRCVAGLSAAVVTERHLHSAANGGAGGTLPVGAGRLRAATAAAAAARVASGTEAPTLAFTALRSLEASLLRFLFGDADDEL
jgi:hypothetical protein